jgi:hypothetical protein
MKAVKYVKKDAVISGGGANYKAVTHDQVISIIRESMVENGIVIEPHQESGGWSVMRDLNASPNPIKMGLYYGKYDIYFVNVDDPKDRAYVSVEAHASDNGDKAPGKCITYATKTAILKMFTLETGINDEHRDDVVKISDDISDKFRYLIDSGDSIGLYDFMAQYSIDDPIRKDLFNCFEYGKKTIATKAYGDLLSEANRTFDEWSTSVISAIFNDDETGVQEFWWDLSDLHKTKVWPRLSKETQDNLKDRKKPNEQ